MSVAIPTRDNIHQYQCNNPIVLRKRNINNMFYKSYKALSRHILNLLCEPSAVKAAFCGLRYKFCNRTVWKQKQKVLTMNLFIYNTIYYIACRVLINSRFGVSYSNFSFLTPTFWKVSIEKYGKTPTFSGRQHFTPIFKILVRTLAW